MKADYGLYLVTDELCLRGRALLPCVEAALEGGVTLVQYRSKESSSAHMYQEALALQALCSRYQVPLVINDRLDIAMAVGAAGVHLGQDDLPCRSARRILGPEAIIGVSAHNLDEAARATADGASYIGCGAVFATATKADVQQLGLAVLAQLVQAATIPVVGIGGIDRTNYGDVLRTGAAGAAIVSGILAAHNIRERAAELAAQLRHYRETQQLYRAVIFDLDGTLINSLADLANSANAALRALKLPQHDHESYKYRVGNGIRKLMERALPPERQDLLDTALALFKADYAEHSLDYTRPYAGIAELLRALQQRGVKLGICTNKHDEAARHIAAELFPNVAFDAIIGDKPGLPRKPDPGKVLLMAQQWQLPPAAIAYLGDSGVDMQTACNAGMLPVGVLWGFREQQELLENGAQLLLRQPLELLAHLNFPDIATE